MISNGESADQPLASLLGYCSVRGSCITSSQPQVLAGCDHQLICIVFLFVFLSQESLTRRSHHHCCFCLVSAGVPSETEYGEEEAVLCGERAARLI